MNWPSSKANRDGRPYIETDDENLCGHFRRVVVTLERDPETDAEGKREVLRRGGEDERRGGGVRALEARLTPDAIGPAATSRQRHRHLQPPARDRR